MRVLGTRRRRAGALGLLGFVGACCLPGVIGVSAADRVVAVGMPGPARRVGAESVPTTVAETDESSPPETDPAEPGAPGGPARTPSGAPPQTPFPLELTAAEPAPLIAIPPGCPAPVHPAAVFDGTVVATAGNGARFRVELTRAGSLGPFQVGDMVDVVYVGDSRFLHVGSRYIVGAASSRGRLFSKVREAAPMFGGDAVVGVNDVDVECPVIEDSVRTLTMAGKPVDTGVFTELKSSRSKLALILLGPLVVGLGLLIGLATLRHLFGAAGRGVRATWRSEAAALRRDRG